MEMRLQSPSAPGLIRSSGSSGCSGAGGAPPLERRGAVPLASAPRVRVVTGVVKPVPGGRGQAGIGAPAACWGSCLRVARPRVWVARARRTELHGGRKPSEGPAARGKPGRLEDVRRGALLSPWLFGSLRPEDALRSRSALLSPRPPELGKTGNWKEFFSGCFLSLNKNSVERQAGRQWKEPRL